MIAPTCAQGRLALELFCALVIYGFACGPSDAATKNNARSATERKQAPKSTKAEDPRQAQARQSAERERLVERIAMLKKEIGAGEKSRAGTAAALARAERALADVDTRLMQLAERQHGMQQRIVDLDKQRSTYESEIAERQTELARTATALLANADQDSMKLYLTGRDPSSVMLNEVYLGFIARAEVAQVVALRGRVSELQQQKQHADAENRALAEEAAAQKSARESLVGDRSTHKNALTKLSQKLVEQRKSASVLEAGEQRLSRVVEQLQREIDRRAVEERARREAAKRHAEELNAQAAAAARKKSGSRGSPSRTREEAPPTRVDVVPDASVVNGEFAQQRGRLRLPARGSLIARFGTPRGDGGASWKGIFIRTDANAEVRAVAAGRVVFADYLRGFGNLLIVDHGDQYLSIYGSNETLLRHVGDAVKAGDVLSLSGNSSGDDQTGLYFELRFRGRPFDPMGWVGVR